MVLSDFSMDNPKIFVRFWVLVPDLGDAVTFWQVNLL